MGLTCMIYLAVSIRVDLTQDTVQHTICVFESCDRVSRERSAQDIGRTHGGRSSSVLSSTRSSRYDPPYAHQGSPRAGQLVRPAHPSTRRVPCSEENCY